MTYRTKSSAAKMKRAKSRSFLPRKRSRHRNIVVVSVLIIALLIGIALASELSPMTVLMVHVGSLFGTQVGLLADMGDVATLDMKPASQSDMSQTQLQFVLSRYVLGAFAGTMLVYLAPQFLDRNDVIAACVGALAGFSIDTIKKLTFRAT